MTDKPYSKEAICEHMVQWFLQNYEDAAESTPVDGGEYVYIWGGPVDAREELDDKFGGLFHEDLIEAATETLEEDDEATPIGSLAVAECDSCGGHWIVPLPLSGPQDPELLEGVCEDCQKDRDVEKPLTFRKYMLTDPILGWPELPAGWLTL
jgi:hypothetical protein